ncbi:DUF881 domain-containing protein [Lachnospiraceae bacterium NSJ-143]|nr:DUF881 domain-containing protein [Lachnospiraceae bacterium NSJ-143]
MIKFNRNVVISSAVCICLGFFSCSLLVNAYNDANNGSNENIRKLTDLLSQSYEENRKLLDELENKNKSISEYEDAVSNDSAALKLMKEELENARKLAGTSELAGEGIIITLNDSKAESGNVASSSLVIHDEDLLLFINELNSAGAEAISINGQRIVSRSSVKCAGSIINVNGVRVSAPFIIKAIGDPEVMEAALRFKGGVIDSLKPWGFTVEISHEENIVIGPYSQPIIYEHSSNE